MHTHPALTFVCLSNRHTQTFMHRLGLLGQTDGPHLIRSIIFVIYVKCKKIKTGGILHTHTHTKTGGHTLIHSHR